MFWPMSNTVSPAGVRRIFTGFSSSIARTGGPAGATIAWLGASATTRTGAQEETSYPGALQPAFSSRAS
jgi:hypothetical protein